MAINAQLTADFKQAALDIFNSMVTNDGEYYEDKTQYDPVTGVGTAGTQYTIRMARVKKEKTEQYSAGTTDEEVKFIMLVDETPVPVTTSGAIVYEGMKYEINGADQDPANVLWFVEANRV